MRKLLVLMSPEKGGNSQKRIYREISATCKSEKKQKYQKILPFFTNFVLPTAVKSENKPDRAATAADREVAVIPAAPFIPAPPKDSSPCPRHQIPVPDKWEIGIKKNTGWIPLPYTYIHTYLCILYPLAIYLFVFWL